MTLWRFNEKFGCLEWSLALDEIFHKINVDVFSFLLALSQQQVSVFLRRTSAPKEFSFLLFCHNILSKVWHFGLNQKSCTFLFFILSGIFSSPFMCLHLHFLRQWTLALKLTLFENTKLQNNENYNGNNQQFQYVHFVREVRVKEWVKWG